MKYKVTLELAKLKAERDDYKKALEFYSVESRIPQSMCGADVSIYTKRQIELSKDNGKLSREVLAKWRKD